MLREFSGGDRRKLENPAEREIGTQASVKMTKQVTHNNIKKVAEDSRNVAHSAAEKSASMMDGRFTMMRGFHLADCLTIGNGVCGTLSLFNSANFLLTGQRGYLWVALVLPAFGFFFDAMDGKVARWRKTSSMLGQELDSLADLVKPPV